MFLNNAAAVSPQAAGFAVTTVGFVGGNMLQLMVEENDVTEDPSRNVGTEVKSWAGANAFDRQSGVGTLNGNAGTFSNNIHTAAPQLFRKWSSVNKTTYTDDFTGTPPVADTASNWSVKVNGSPASVTALYRKTVPIFTGQTAQFVFSNRKRHLVTFVLGSTPAIGATITIEPPSGPPISVVRTAALVSEAVHVCLAGYAAAWPKKAYVGLWLGHDAAASIGSTDASLSTSTAWSLRNVGTDTVVSTGALTLAKAATSAHQTAINYNGCDIYQADFSAVTAAGTYRIEIADVGASPEFVISVQPYAEALRLAARWYFHQRSGCAIASGPGEGRVRPRNGHPADGLTVYRTGILLGRFSEGFLSGDVFSEIAKVNTGSGAPNLAPSTALTSTSVWNGSLNATAADFQVAGGVLTANATSGFQTATLVLTAPLIIGHSYTLTLEVDALTSNGNGFRVQLAGSGNSGVQTITGTGTQTIQFAAIAAAYPQLYFDKSGVTSVTVSAITLTDDPPVNPNAWGGWHDAGDWDRRIQHMEVIHVMATLVELFPSTRTLNLNLPESGKTFADAAVMAKKGVGDAGNGTAVLPDLIHEALWGISLWRRTQGVGGGIIGGVEYSNDGTEGSVSWNPIQNTYAYAEEEWSAYQFVTAAAKLGHVISTICGDTVLGAALIAEAASAWAWAEGVLGTGIDAYNVASNTNIAKVRIAAAASLYRANGNSGAKAVFENYNAFSPLLAESYGTVRGDYTLEAGDYVQAGVEGRLVNTTISGAISSWFSGRYAAEQSTELGADYGLHNTTLYAWGAGWLRFGPGSNWRARRLALGRMASGSITPGATEKIVEGMWFALGCNPSNVSLVQGVGGRTFGNPLAKDFEGFARVPGHLAFGACGGNLRSFEIAGTAGAIFPANDQIWPRYARIFESRRAVVSSEHGMKSNALEWLFACAMVNEAIG